jgi:hypothetical protein
MFTQCRVVGSIIAEITLNRFMKIATADAGEQALSCIGSVFRLEKHHKCGK